MTTRAIVLLLATMAAVGERLPLRRRTNTRGGMNMNCGLHDAWTLAEAFRAEARDTALDAWAQARRSVAVDELVPRTDRSVGGGATFLAAVEATARDPARALQFVRDAAMLDIAPRFDGEVGA